MTRRQLKARAAEHGTPLVVVDHGVVRRSYAEFTRHLPTVQTYYSVKANPEPEIIRTLYQAGAGFDVASMREFRMVHETIGHLGAKEQRQFISDKVIFANPIKPQDTLSALDPCRPLVTFDNADELEKIRRHAPRARVIVRLRVVNTGSQCELSSKFGCDPGQAVDLIQAALASGLVVEGVSFHVGSQCTNFDNFVQALNVAASVMQESKDRGHDIRMLDIGGGFPARYNRHVRPFPELARVLNAEISRLFAADIRVLAEPGRFLVASAAVAIASVIGRAVRDGKTCYYIDDSVYHTFSGIVFDHCQYPLHAFRRGKEEVCAVFGQTCDGLDTISQSELLPALDIGDLVFAKNIGAYSSASATWFNGFPPAKIVHLNE